MLCLQNSLISQQNQEIFFELRSGPNSYMDYETKHDITIRDAHQRLLIHRKMARNKGELEKQKLETKIKFHVIH